MRLSVEDPNIYTLPNTDNRFTHLATVRDRIRSFMVFVDDMEHKLYIEEITTGDLKTIDDDTEFDDLFKFCENKGLLQRWQRGHTNYLVEKSED